MKEFIQILIAASEKAANIARIIRNEKELFSLLIQEKDDQEKNKRFVQDFKTLADVLIQESLRFDISAKYPAMQNNIYGEEDNTFSNALGESITVKVLENAEKTAELLAKVLDGSSQAAKLLAGEIHKDMEIKPEEDSSVPDNLIDTYEDIGIWIDPIDGTNEYIKGCKDLDFHDYDDEPVWAKGLHCVTVLIGAFHLKSGEPLAGVVNQPFWTFNKSTKEWKGRCFWGIDVNGQKYSSPLLRDDHSKKRSKKLAILSSSEDSALQAKLETNFDLVFSSGAGYKLLCVALGQADVYLLSKPTTHYWDTCGPHAILKALGGSIFKYEDLLSQSKGSQSKASEMDVTGVSYLVDDLKAKETKFANLSGIVAVIDNEIKDFVLSCLE